MSILQGLLLRLYLLCTVLLNRWNSSQIKICVYVQDLMLYSPDKFHLYCPYKTFTSLILISGLGFLDVLQSFLFAVQALWAVAQQTASLLICCACWLQCCSCCSYRRLFCFVYLFYMLAIVIYYSSSCLPPFCSPNDWESLQVNSFSCQWYGIFI